jgi:hypothetical protein
MTEAERDAKIQAILTHQPPYHDAVQRINKVHDEYAQDQLALKTAGVDLQGTPSPGRSNIKQPGSDPVVRHR